MTTDFQLMLKLDEALTITLHRAGMGVSEMADYLGVTRGSVGNWISGRRPPSKQTLRLWALRTGVPYEWLAGLPRLDSNQQPSGYRILQVITSHPRPLSGLKSLISADASPSPRDLRHTRHLRRVS